MAFAIESFPSSVPNILNTCMTLDYQQNVIIPGNLQLTNHPLAVSYGGTGLNSSSLNDLL